MKDGMPKPCAASRARRIGVMILPILTVSLATIPAAEATELAVPTQDVIGSQLTDKLDPDILTIMRHQEALNPAITILTEAAMKLPKSGLASIAFERDGLALYWKGPLDAAMVEALAQARLMGPVEVRAAPFSESELEVAATKIEVLARGDTSLAKSSRSRQGSNIQSVVIKHDGTGLIIEKMPAATAATVAVTQGRALTPAEDIVAAVGLGVPVEFEIADGPLTFRDCQGGVCNRKDDESPWNSGVRTRITYPTQGGSTVGTCTSGFGVNVPSYGTTYVWDLHLTDVRFVRDVPQ